MPSDPLTDAKQAVVQIGKWTAVRDAALVAAVAKGCGLREIARAVEMSPTGVRKIIDRSSA